MSYNFITTKDPPLFISINPLFNNIQPFIGNNEQHLIYELVMINGSINPIRILAININMYTCKHKKLSYTISEQKLANIFSTISTANDALPEDPVLQPNETGLLYIFLDLPCKIGNILEHNVIVQTENDPSTIQSIIIDPIKINRSQPIIVNPPLKGNNWYAANAPDNFVLHRRTLFMLNGRIKIPERTAIDFLKYGPEGLYDGDPLKNTSYYSYGNQIYSRCDGTIIGLMDGIEENIPTKLIKDPINSKNIAGNYVLIELDENHYALLAHMIPGSLKVKIGDNVKVGQKVGLLGNSGESLAPHLHFQITNKPYKIGNYKEPSPINAQGIPWVFNRFVINQYIPIGTSILGSILPENVEIISKNELKNQIPMNDNLVNF